MKVFRLKREGVVGGGWDSNPRSLEPAVHVASCGSGFLFSLGENGVTLAQGGEGLLVVNVGRLSTATSAATL